MYAMHSQQAAVAGLAMRVVIDAGLPVSTGAQVAVMGEGRSGRDVLRSSSSAVSTVVSSAAETTYPC